MIIYKCGKEISTEEDYYITLYNRKKGFDIHLSVNVELCQECYEEVDAFARKKTIRED